jgi:RimJ/RimL family protein N-acetyltransferase
MAEPQPILIDLPDQFVGTRIILHPWCDSDAEAVYALVDQSREHIRRWLPWPDEYHTVDDSRAYLRREAAQWMARENFAMGIFDRDGYPLGSVALHPKDWRIPSFEIGYWIGAPYQGHGYVTEAVQLVTKLAFETFGAHRVFIRCDARNERSANVARRCGYVYEGTFRSDHRLADGGLRDTMFFSRIPEDANESK